MDSTRPEPARAHRRQELLSGWSEHHIGTEGAPRVWPGSGPTGGDLALRGARPGEEGQEEEGGRAWAAGRRGKRARLCFIYESEVFCLARLVLFLREFVPSSGTPTLGSPMPLEEPSSAASLGAAEEPISSAVMKNVEGTQAHAVDGGGTADAANYKGIQDLLRHHHGRQYRPKEKEEAADTDDLRGTNFLVQHKLGTEKKGMNPLVKTAVAALTAASDETAEYYGEEMVNCDIRTRSRSPPHGPGSQILKPTLPGAVKVNVTAATDKMTLLDASGKGQKVKRASTAAKKMASPLGAAKVNATAATDEVALVDAAGKGHKVKRGSTATKKASPLGAAKVNAATATDEVALVDAAGKGQTTAKQEPSPPGEAKAAAAINKLSAIDADNIGSYRGSINGKIICLVGFSPKSYDKVEQKIRVLGGSAVSATLSSLVCMSDDPGGKIILGEKVVTQNWIDECYACIEPTKETPSGKSNGTESSKVIKSLSFDEICENNHQLFFCKCDQSVVQWLPDIIARIKPKKDVMLTPGNILFKDCHRSIVTVDELKVVVKLLYVLVKALHQAGFCLKGKFQTKHFVVDEAKGEKNMRFTGLGEGSVHPTDNEGEQLDWSCFESMVRNEMFGNDIPAHDLNLWLTLLDDKELSDLVPRHVFLLPLDEWSNKYMTMYAEFLNSGACNSKDVLDSLSCYSGWKDVFKQTGCNGLLSASLQHSYVNKDGIKVKANYEDDVHGLLKAC